MISDAAEIWRKLKSTEEDFWYMTNELKQQQLGLGNVVVVVVVGRVNCRLLI